MKRGGFTIVELMVCVGIIAILLTIVVVAAQGSLGKARVHRTAAMQTALEQGLAAYYAELGEWPRAIEAKANSNERPNADNGNAVTFTEGETDEIFREVVGKAFGEGRGAKSALVDVSALFVAKTAGLQRTPDYGCTHCGYGRELSELTNAGSDERVPISQLSFGYPCAEHGRFCRFWIKYNVRSDSVSVLTGKPKSN